MKKLFFLFLLCFSINCLANSPLAFQRYYLGEYAKAKPGLEKLAKEKNAKAGYLLAKIYLDALNEPQNIPHGLALMRKSAKLNYLPAQMYLGAYYFERKQSIKKSLPWFTSAALNGDVNAQTFVAYSLLEGFGTKKSAGKARKFIILAAKKGNPYAQFELARIFLSSKHKKNKMMGRIWLKKSAQQNYQDAELLLGKMLYSGLDIKQNKQEGLALIKKAADSGSAGAKEMQKRLQHALSTKSEPVIEVGELEKKSESHHLDEAQQLKKIQLFLKKARVSFQSIPLFQNKSLITRATPKLPIITKKMVIKPDYSLVLSKSIPLSEIITYTAKESYKKSSPEMIFPRYSFVRPKNAASDEAAFKNLQHLSDLGYAKAQFMLGKMYEDGIFVKKNEALALKYYLKSAEQNYLKADYAVGLFYLTGKVVEKNYKSALLWLSKSALRGSSNAQYVLGFLYEYGYGNESGSYSVQRELSKSRAMYSLAASHGFALAEYRLAQLYSSGLLNPSNNQDIKQAFQKKAFKLYQAASKKGIKSAKLELAFFKALKSKSNKKLKKVFEIAKTENSKGIDKATFLLAILYERGLGTKEKNSKALDLFEDLSEENNSYAQFVLGTNTYLDDQSDPEATELLELSAENGCAYAQYNLAIIAYKNSKNSPQFLGLLKEAAKNNFNKANILLADYYLSQGNKKTIKNAAMIYQALSKQADSTAELKLGYMYEHGIYYPVDFSKALEWYQRSAAHNNPLAEYLLARLYQAGKGVPRNIQKAIDLYKKSASKHFAPAEVALGFINQREGSNRSAALKWYRIAASQKNPVAQYNLALFLLREGRDNQSEAFEEALQSALQGFTPAKSLVAKMYLEGLGTSYDVQKALSWYQKAAKLGDATALYALGLIAESGVNNEINTESAFHYYKQAASHGNNKAKIAVARFYQFGTASTINLSKAISYYHLAAENGSTFAQYWLNQLSKPDSEKINTKYCSRIKVTGSFKESIWKKMSNIFRSKPNKEFLIAISAFNEGKLSRGQTILKAILAKHPNFTPAKILLQSYTC